MPAKKDLFDPSNEVSSNFFKFESVGDQLVGTLVAKSEPQPNRLKPDTTQIIYTLVDDDGTEWQVAGRILCTKSDGSKVSRFPQLDKLKPGAYVGVKFCEEKPPVKPGYNATKIVKVFHDGETKPDVLEAYLGVGAPSNEIKVEDIPL